nr:hypothetical protein GCM10010200_104300 [Actinomadura rugatobispora]
MSLPTTRPTTAGPVPPGRPPSAPGKILTTRTGLVLPPRLPLDAWKEIGAELSVLWDSATWWQGDWLVYGQDRYPDRYQYALEDSGLDYQTLRNYAWVARRFPPGRRRARLSLQHHAEVASLSEEDQDEWLDRAEREGWSRNRLRRHLQDHEAGGRRLGSGPDGTLALKVPSGRHERWLRAAERRGSGLTSWIAQVLDQAAERTLEASRPVPGPRALHHPAAADGPARHPGDHRPPDHRPSDHRARIPRHHPAGAASAAKDASPARTGAA